jgi:hypothetical protein
MAAQNAHSLEQIASRFEALRRPERYRRTGHRPCWRRWSPTLVLTDPKKSTFLVRKKKDKKTDDGNQPATTATEHVEPAV